MFLFENAGDGVDGEVLYVDDPALNRWIIMISSKS